MTQNTLQNVYMYHGMNRNSLTSNIKKDRKPAKGVCEHEYKFMHPLDIDSFLFLLLVLPAFHV
jgi:hypothetical protein